MSKVDSAVDSAAFERQVRARPDAPALRFKLHGRWRVWTWRTLDREVNALLRGLTAAGFRRGERLWQVGAPGPRQLAMLLAAEQAGGVVVPLDVDSVRDTADARRLGAPPELAFVEDRDAFDLLEALLLDRRGAPPRVIIFDDPRGLRAANNPRLRAYESFRARESPDREPSVGSGGCALLLPVPWREGVRDIVSLWLETGFQLALPERHGSLEADTRELAPAVLLGDAPAARELVDSALDRLPRAGTLHRRLLDRSLGGLQGTARPAGLERLLVLRPLRRALGLRNARLVVTVGADLPARTRAIFDALEIRAESLVEIGQWGVDLDQSRPAGPSVAEPARGIA